MDATSKAVKEAILSQMNAMHPTGYISKAKMATILEGVGMPKDGAQVLLSAIDVNQDGDISQEELVSWVFKTKQDISDGALESAVSLRVETMTGDLAAVLHMSLENTVWEVKGRLAEVTDMPQGKQQLVLQHSVLKNDTYLHACGIQGPDAVLTLVKRLTVPKLSELENMIQELDEISDAGPEDVARTFSNLFQHHDLNKPILVPERFSGHYEGEGEFDEESGGAYDGPYDDYDASEVEATLEEKARLERFGPNEAMEDLGFEIGAPALWHVVDMQKQLVSPGTVCVAAKWMLSRGAHADVEWKNRSVAKLALEDKSEALLRDLSLAGAKPSLHDLLSALPNSDELGGRSGSGSPTLSALLKFLDLVLELAKSYPLEDREKAFAEKFQAEDDCDVWRKARLLDLGVTPDTAMLGWWADKQSDTKLLAASMDAAMQEACRLEPEVQYFWQHRWPEDLQTRYKEFADPLNKMELDRREEYEREEYGADEF
mmetsp:Transcript_4042/g.7131  ORF Transcript_4042/g.7131 Transcript_4042/m.7131 type:complete len:488 (+) Transcript_4042:140-1603(+)